MFPDKTSSERARFAFYEALRKTTDPRLAEAKDKIEVCLNRKLMTITLRHRVANPFFQTMEKVLGEGLAKGQAQAPPESEQDALQASLAKFDSLREKGETPVARPRNPYFSREE